MRFFCHSKIQKMTVTDANLEYEGSITLDPEVIQAAGILPYEKVQVLNLANGHRLETYVIEGQPGSGVCCLNGPAAHLCSAGDRVTIVAYKLSEEPLVPTVVSVDANNVVTDVQVSQPNV